MSEPTHQSDTHDAPEQDAPEAESSRSRTKPKKKSRKKLFFVSAVIGGIGASFFLGVFGTDQEQMDQAFRDGMQSAISRAAGAITSMFGDSLQTEYGMRVYLSELDQWARLDSDKQNNEKVVVLVHGLDEPGGIWDQLAPALARQGHTVVRFDYANDQAIKLSASSLLDELSVLEGAGVQEISFVCHSMGGLVVRDAITRDVFEEQPIRVDRLVTIGTPHGGSPWARLRAVAEIREQVQRWVESDDLDPKRLLGFAQDGVGQAGTDLLPGSDFFKELNQRTLDPAIQITCIVGRTVPESGRDLGSLIASGVMSELIGERDTKVIGDELEKLSSELGDGVVPMSSAVLAGVDDVVVLEANHRSLIRSVELGEAIRELQGLGASGQPPAIEVVLDRLNQD